MLALSNYSYSGNSCKRNGSLTESQVKINDRNIVQLCLKLPNSSVPLNDGTNACVFLNHWSNR